MNERQRSQENNDSLPGGLGNPFGDDNPPDAPVTVSSGPYHEQLPVGNTTVGQIRRRFHDRLDIDPDSQAVLDGAMVDDETTVRPGQALMFTRHSGEKGNSLPLDFEAIMEATAQKRKVAKLVGKGTTVQLEGNEAVARSPEGQSARMPLPTLVQQLAPAGMSTGNVILPDGLKSIHTHGNYTIWVHETPPAVHRLKWIAADSESQYGQGTSYREVSLSLPYLIVLAVFEKTRMGLPMLSSFNECFFRNSPLKGPEDELLYPALLNCSKFDPPQGKPLSWICSQYLRPNGQMRDKDPNIRLRASFKALRHCLLETGFNYSSEHHEASSWFTESRKVDSRVATVEAWEKASRENALFALEVPWLKTGHSLAQVVERIFKNQSQNSRNHLTATGVARLVFNHPQVKKTPTHENAS